MDTAIGVNIAQTATLGRQVVSNVLASTQTVIWDFIDGPTRERTFSAMRRSRPMSAHGKVIKPEPKTKIMLSQEY